MFLFNFVKNTVFGLTDEEEFNETISKFREHEAQWRLNKRGVEGETLVHLLLNREEPLCTEIARILIHNYSGLARDVFLGDEMFGKNGIKTEINIFRSKLFAFGNCS